MITINFHLSAKKKIGIYKVKSMALYDDILREKISKLPNLPGVYQYFDSLGNIIYIGKAKNLKNRGALLSRFFG